MPLVCFVGYALAILAFSYLLYRERHRWPFFKWRSSRSTSSFFKLLKAHPGDLGIEELVLQEARRRKAALNNSRLRLERLTNSPWPVQVSDRKESYEKEVIKLFQIDLDQTLEFSTIVGQEGERFRRIIYQVLAED